MSSQILSQESGGLPKTIEVQAAAMRGDPRKVKAQAKINDELITLMAANSAISDIKRKEDYLASLLEGNKGGTLKDRKPKELENAIIASNMQKLQPKIDQAMGIAAQNKRKSDKNIQQVAMGRNQPTGLMPRPVKTKMAQGGIARFQGLSGSQVNAITDDELKKMGLTRSQYEALSDDDKKSISAKRTRRGRRPDGRTAGSRSISKVLSVPIDETLKQGQQKIAGGIKLPLDDTDTTSATADVGIPAVKEKDSVDTTKEKGSVDTTRPNFSTIAPTGLSPYIARDPMITQEMITGTGGLSPYIARPPATGPATDPTTGTGIPNAGVAKIDDSNIKQMIEQLGTGDYTVPQDLITQSIPQGLMTQLEGDAAKDPMSAFKLSDARLKEMGISREDYDKLGFIEQQELFFDRKGQKEKREANLTKLKTLGDEQATPEKQQARKARAFFAVYSPVQRALQQQERKEESSKYQRTLRTIGLDDENMKRDFEIANSISQETGKVYGEIAADRRTAMAALSNIGIENAKAAEQRLESKKNDDRSKLGALIDMFTVEANRAMTEAKVLAQQETSRAMNQTNRIQAIGTLITGLNSLRVELRETVKESMSPDTMAAIEKAKRDPESLNKDDDALIADYQLELEAANPDSYFELQNAFLKALGIDLGTYFKPLEKNKNTSTQAITKNFDPNAPSS